MKYHKFAVYITLVGVVMLSLYLSRTAHAQMESNMVTASQTLGTMTLLKRRPNNDYYFSPTYITCKTYVVCFTIVNRTGRWVVITDTAGNFIASLNPGATCREDFGYPGTYYYTVAQQNIKVPLTVHVH